MKSRIALIPLVALTLVISLWMIVPAYAQEATEATPVKTVEPFAPLSLGGSSAEATEAAPLTLGEVVADLSAATETAEATAAIEATTVPATAEATEVVEVVPTEAATATEEATVEAAVGEDHPVAGTSVGTETSNPVPGGTVLVFLVGIGAVGLVGFGAWMRENYKTPEDK